MPLTRTNITAASRVMLPTYALFFGAVGLSLVATPQARLHRTPAFEYADRWVDLTLWGTGYLAVAVALVLALALRNRRGYRTALAAGFVWMIGWAILTLLAAFNGAATYSAWIWPAFIAVACWASLVSLAAGER